MTSSPSCLTAIPPEQRKGMGAVKIFSHRSRRSPPRKPSLKRRPRTRPGTAGRRDAHGSFRRRGRTRHRFAPRRRAHSSSSRCRRTSHGQASLSEPALPVRMQDRNRAIDPQAGRPLTFSMKPHERPWRVSRYLAARRQQGCRKALGYCCPISDQQSETSQTRYRRSLVRNPQLSDCVLYVVVDRIGRNAEQDSHFVRRLPVCRPTQNIQFTSRESRAQPPLARPEYLRKVLVCRIRQPLHLRASRRYFRCGERLMRACQRKHSDTSGGIK